MNFIENKRTYIAVIIATIIGLGIMFFSSKKAPYQRISGIVWTTEYHIIYQGDKNFSDSINKVFNAIDNSVSMFNPASTISLINHNDSSVCADAYTKFLYSRSKEIYAETGGSFDPTVGPLVNAWRFGYEKRNESDSVNVRDILPYIGLDKINIASDGSVTKTDSRVVIDFSSIAKGFACDEIGRLLQRNGVCNYMIEIGGEICINGINEHGQPWHISVDKPIEQNDTVIHSSAIVLAVSGKGIATSGNYRNFKTVNGMKVSHIINPLTGYPEKSDLLSATIIASTTADADAYATACMVLGTERSQKLIESNPHIEALLIFTDKHGNVSNWHSSRFEKMIIK